MVKPFHYKHKLSAKLKTVLSNFNKINNFKKRKWNWFRFKFSQNQQKKWQFSNRASIFTSFLSKNRRQSKNNIFNNNFSQKNKRFYKFFYVNCLFLRHLLKNSYSFLKNKQLKKLFFKSRTKNLSNFIFLKKLNTRLDAVVYHFLYHLNIFKSFHQLRKFILYKGMLINNKLCKNPNTQIKPNDIIELPKEPKLNIILLLFKTRFCNWLKYFHKQLYILQEYRKKKLQKRLYLFLSIRKKFRQKATQYLYKNLNKINMKNLKGILKYFKYIEYLFESFKFDYFSNYTTNINFDKFYILSKKITHSIKKKIKLFYKFNKIKTKLIWIQKLKTILKKNKNTMLLKKIIKLEHLFYNFIKYNAYNFINKIKNNKQIYNFLHIDYNNFTCILLENVANKKNLEYANNSANLNYISYIQLK